MHASTTIKFPTQCRFRLAASSGCNVILIGVVPLAGVLLFCLSAVGSKANILEGGRAPYYSELKPFERFRLQDFKA